MHSRIQTLYIARKDQSPNVHGLHQSISKKIKRTGKPNTHS